MSWLLTLTLLTAPADQRDWFPAQLAGWQRAATPEVWDRETVFDYMDGKAEIYLTYAMTHVTTVTYQLGEKHAEVLLFDLGTAAEAYGMYSNDLSGEPVMAMQGARFVDGLFRGWQGPLLLKLEGEPDTPEFKPFCIAMANEIAKHQHPGPELPPLSAALPITELALTELHYFHQVMCLDALYYLSTRNVLELSAQTNALLASGKLADQPLQVLLVEYGDPGTRDTALAGFREVVLSDQAKEGPIGVWTEELAPGLFTGVTKVDGRELQPRLVCCLDAVSVADCRAVLALLVKSAGPPEAAP